MVELRLNLGCGKVPKAGFINVDRLCLPGVDQQVDLFQFPWPWGDNSVDEIYASHLIEHIPHQVEGSQLDGFFAFFAECWRILKPGAEITLIAPYGFSVGAMQDPTHTRFIVESTFSYLAQVDDCNFDYQLPFTFRAKMLALGIGNIWMPLNEGMPLGWIYQPNSIHSILCTLEAIK